MTPRTGKDASRPKSGARDLTVASSATSIRISNRFRATATGEGPPIASRRPGGGSQGLALSAGKSISIRSPRRVARSRPLSVSNSAGSSGSRIPSSHSACALARVAWPQSSTSTAGVNQRRPNASPMGCRKAVSDRFISRATSCIHSGWAGPSSRHTAAGLPRNGRSVNESICSSFMRRSLPAPRVSLGAPHLRRAPGTE